jgi:hypothetical protein
MDDIHELIKNNTPEAQKLVYELRKLIRSLAPGTKEKIYKGWGVIDYQMGGRRDFISIGPQKKYVNLYFMRGVELADPAKLLEGSGKNMRHIKIRSSQDLKNKKMHKLILLAAKLK